MRKATLDKMREIRDTGIVPESMYNVISKKGTIYGMVHAEEFPHEEVLQLALAASEAKPDSMPLLISALNNSHALFRYWGAIGCTNLSARGHSTEMAHEVLKKHAATASDPVAIASAEALAAAGDRESGKAAFLRILSATKDDMVALQALNMVQALKMAEEIPRDIYARACKTGNYPGRMIEDYPE